MKRRISKSLQRVLAGGMAGLVLFLALAHVVSAQSLPESDNALNAAPDLVVTEIRFLPPEFGAGDEVDITPVVKNQGDADAAVIKLYLYVEPEQDPPTSETTVDGQTTFGLGLAAGDTFDGWTRTSFPITQDNPQICVLVDPDNQVAESNEDNNLFCVKSPPAQEPPPDVYEDDDACTNAKEIGVNQSQERNLSRRDKPQGVVVDTDWISLTVESGVEYTAEVTPVGEDAADTNLELYGTCTSPGSFGAGNKLTFTAPSSGIYYLKVTHLEETYGPDTTYTFKVTRYAACSTFFEPNNQCSVPVDFPLSLGEQEHDFCAANDVDWVRFEVQAGGKYRVSTENVGSRADAQLSLFKDCTGGLAESQLTFVAPASGYYYIELKNNDGDVFGSDTNYKVQIEELEKGCSPDRYEEDDSVADAQPVSIDSTKPTHNICPKGDVDWFKIEASKRMTFTVETVDLAADADTKLCLHDANGEKLRCDLDSGAGVGSRLVMADAPEGTYYFSVQDESAEVAGDSTEYKLQAVSGSCTPDQFEPNNLAASSTALAGDGTKQQHNICGADDADWLALDVTSGNHYVVQTSPVGGESDTVLEVYDPDNNLVGRNDDFSQSVNSQVSFTAQKTGTYHAKVQLYNPTYYGSGTEYEVSFRQGEPDEPVDPEENAQDPQPREEEDPSPSNVRTLILVNRARFAQLYGEEAASRLMAKLDELAADDGVRGEIIRLDRNQQVNQAYANWTGNETNYKSVERANLVTNEIRKVIMTYLSERGGVKFLVLVGDDRVLPFRRIQDNTPQQSEKTYELVSDNHPTGAALRANYFLSDDFYSTKRPIAHEGRELYVPDLTTGRLLETADDIIGMIDTYLANPEPELQRAFVSGYDFVKDAAGEDCKLWRKQLSEERVECIVGENWTRDQFIQRQLNTESTFTLQSINGHADHYRQGVPAGGGGGEIKGSVIDAVGGLNYNGGLIYTLACHAGLNVPDENSVEPLDLVQAFTRKGANYIGNTGYGWGYLYGMGLSETLINLFTKELAKGGDIGVALTKAKQNYYRVTNAETPYDEKVMQQLTFYGLPMFRIPASLPGDDPFPGVDDDFDIGQALGDPSLVISTTTSYTFTRAITGEQSVLSLSSEEGGDFVALADYSVAATDQPIQPLFFRNVSAPTAPVRGAVLRSATVNQEQLREGFNPIIATADNEFVDNGESRLEPGSGNPQAQDDRRWYPPLNVTALAVDNQSLLSAQLGQYNPSTQQQRVFDNIQVDLYYSTSTDEAQPEFVIVDGLYDPQSQRVTAKVGVLDPSGIAKVTLHYIEDDRQAVTTVKSVDLRYDKSLIKWVGSFPGGPNTVFYVTAVDRAGNPRTENNKGINYRPAPARASGSGSASCTGNCIFLPFVAK